VAATEEPRDFGDDFTTEHAYKIVDFYSRTLTQLGYKPQPYAYIDELIGERRFDTPKYLTLNHATWMCERTVLFLRAGRLAKAYRWIGTIQGILLMDGVFSIADLKRHNRLDLPPVPPRGK